MFVEVALSIVRSHYETYFPVKEAAPQEIDQKECPKAAKDHEGHTSVAFTLCEIFLASEPSIGSILR